jgi:hypothetical protein
MHFLRGRNQAARANCAGWWTNQLFSLRQALGDRLPGIPRTCTFFVTMHGPEMYNLHTNPSNIVFRSGFQAISVVFLQSGFAVACTPFEDLRVRYGIAFGQTLIKYQRDHSKGTKTEKPVCQTHPFAY